MLDLQRGDSDPVMAEFFGKVDHTFLHKLALLSRELASQSDEVRQEV